MSFFLLLKNNLNGIKVKLKQVPGDKREKEKKEEEEEEEEEEKEIESGEIIVFTLYRKVLDCLT